MDTIYEAYQNIITEAKMSAKELVAILNNKEDWGDMGDQVRVVKGNLEVVDSWFYGEARAMDQLIKSWTTPNGTNAKFFKSEYGVSFKLVNQFSQVKAEGRYKKLTKDGIVGVVLKVV